MESRNQKTKDPFEAVPGSGGFDFFSHSVDKAAAKTYYCHAAAKTYYCNLHRLSRVSKIRDNLLLSFAPIIKGKQVSR